MAKVIITAKIMPSSPDTDLVQLEANVLNVIDAFVGDSDKRVKKEPIGFGIVALMVTFILDEDKGSPDELEAKISALEGVNSFQITDVRRAIG